MELRESKVTRLSRWYEPSLNPIGIAGTFPPRVWKYNRLGVSRYCQRSVPRAHIYSYLQFLPHNIVLTFPALRVFRCDVQYNVLSHCLAGVNSIFSLSTLQFIRKLKLQLRCSHLYDSSVASTLTRFYEHQMLAKDTSRGCLIDIVIYLKHYRASIISRLIELGKHSHLPEDRFNPSLDEYFWMRGVAYIYETVVLEGLSLIVERCFQLRTNGAPPRFLDVDGEVFGICV